MYFHESLSGLNAQDLAVAKKNLKRKIINAPLSLLLKY